MNCTHIAQNEMHEKYILGRLNEADKAGYERHIERCASCRRELEQQKRLIASIRSQARLDMMREIKAQAEKLRGQKPKPNWGIWYKAAAVILLFSVMPAILYYYLQTDRLRTDSANTKIVSDEKSIQSFSETVPVKENKTIAPQAQPIVPKGEKRSTRPKTTPLAKLKSASSPSDKNAMTEESNRLSGLRRRESKDALMPNKGDISNVEVTVAPLSINRALSDVSRSSPKKSLKAKSEIRYPLQFRFIKQLPGEVYNSLDRKQVEKQSTPQFLWIYESDSLRIEILPVGSLADSLMLKSAIASHLEYEIILKEKYRLRMIWRGSGSYTKTAGIPPHIVQKAPATLQVNFLNQKFRFDLNRNKGAVDGLH